jgi:hypothetical protein
VKDLAVADPIRKSRAEQRFRQKSCGISYHPSILSEKEEPRQNVEVDVPKFVVIQTRKAKENQGPVKGIGIKRSPENSEHEH